MRSRALRLSLMLLGLAGIGAAAWYCWLLQTRIDALDRRSAAFDRARVTAARHAADLQFAQQAYVAAGQNETFWFDRVTIASTSLRQAIAALEGATTAAAARTAIADVTEAAGEFVDRDRRVRGYAAAGQRLLAADVIFSDSLEAAARIVAALDRAADADLLERSAERRRLAREQALTAAAGAGAAALVMLLLVPLPAASRAADDEEPRALETSAPAGSLDLRPARGTLGTRPPAPAVAAPIAAAPAVPVAPVAPPIEMQALARICTDLARLDDTTAVPDILERMAATLDARGIVLWVTDTERKDLVPIAAHGYPASVLSRMRALPVDGENATAAAFRTGLLQTVSGDAHTSGAIAAPLVSPGGPVGVMSAEVGRDAEKEPARLAAAMIVAAQLATIVGPPSARAEDRTTAAL